MVVKKKMLKTFFSFRRGWAIEKRGHQNQLVSNRYSSVKSVNWHVQKRELISKVSFGTGSIVFTTNGLETLPTILRIRCDDDDLQTQRNPRYIVYFYRQGFLMKCTSYFRLNEINATHVVGYLENSYNNKTMVLLYIYIKKKEEKVPSSWELMSYIYLSKFLRKN